MPLCTLCGSLLAEDACPHCGRSLPQTFAALPASSFPAAALPPPGVGTAVQRSQLALQLSQGRLAEADALMGALVRTLRPLGAQGRAQLAGTLGAWAELKAARGLAREAEGLGQRSASAAKDPQELHRKQATGEDGSVGWDNHAWLRLQADEGARPPVALVEQVRRDVERGLQSGERKARGFKVAAGALLAFGVADLLGLPLAWTAGLGALVGWVWSLRQ